MKDSYEQRIQNQFGAFCVKVLKNEARHIQREYARLRDQEKSLGELTASELEQTAVWDKHFMDEHLDDIIEFAELRDFMDVPLKNYSSGMVARIAFAIATVVEPDVLIVDETLSVGDVFFQEKCERRIQSFIDSGNVTVLFVSHSLEQVERLCTRAVWIEHGVQRMVGPVKDVCRAYRQQFD